MIEPVNKWGYKRKYAANHFSKIAVWRRKRPYGPSHNSGKSASAEIRAKLSEAHKGKTPWNKGLRSKQAAWNKGITGFKHSAETRQKISAALSSKAPQLHLWKGGVSAKSRGKRTSTSAWRLVRDFVYARDRWECQVCKVHCGKRNIICHHIIPVREGGTDEVGNLATICRSCHQKQEWLYGQRDYHWASRVPALSVKQNPRNAADAYAYRALF